MLAGSDKGSSLRAGSEGRGCGPARWVLNNFWPSHRSAQPGLTPWQALTRSGEKRAAALGSFLGKKKKKRLAHVSGEDYQRGRAALQRKEAAGGKGEPEPAGRSGRILLVSFILQPGIRIPGLGSSYFPRRGAVGSGPPCSEAVPAAEGSRSAFPALIPFPTSPGFCA